MDTLVATRQSSTFLIPKVASFVVAEPEADKARLQAASGTLGHLEQAVGACARERERPQGMGTGMLCATGALLCLNAFPWLFLPGVMTLQSGATTTGGLLTAAGALVIGAGAALMLVPSKLRSARTARRATDALEGQTGNAALVERMSARVPALERAFLARRAAACADTANRLKVSDIVNRQAVTSLDQTAAHLAAVSPAIRAQSAALLEAYRHFFDEAGAPRRFWADAERLTQKIEGLSAEARAILLDLAREMVDAKMEDPGGQLFRVRRLRAALEGTTAPYAKSEEGADTELIDLVDKAIAECATKRPSEFSTTFEIRKVEYSQKDLPKIEPVAAHFEELGYRVALYATPERIVITVYDPATPPDGIWTPSD